MEHTTPTGPDTGQPGSAGRLDRRGVLIFLAVAFGLAWAMELAFALTGGLGTVFARLGVTLVMFTPILGSWAACRATGRPWGPSVGLTRGSWSGHGWRRIVLACLVAVGSVLVLAALALGAAGAFGWLHLDMSLPGLDEILSRAPAGHRPPKMLMLALQVVNIVISAFTINGALALGEETGWRGYLLGQLAPIGRRRAVVLVGAIWGLWHAPLVAMGYEYNGEIPFVVGALLFICFCAAFGVVLAALRTRSGSVIPSAVGHGALNGVGLVPVLFIPVAQFRPVWQAIFGVPGVLVLAVVAALLLWRLDWTPTEPPVVEPVRNQTPPPDAGTPVRRVVQRRSAGSDGRAPR